MAEANQNPNSLAYKLSASDVKQIAVKLQQTAHSEIANLMPVHIACMCSIRNLEAIKTLAEEHPESLMKKLGQNGSLPIHCALAAEEGRPLPTLDVLDYLVGACPESLTATETQYGMTPLHYLVQNKSLSLDHVACLVQARPYEISLVMRNRDGYTPRDLFSWMWQQHSEDLTTYNQVYFLLSDKEREVTEWLDEIRKILDKIAKELGTNSDVFHHVWEFLVPESTGLRLEG